MHADTVVKSLMRWAGIAADASSPIAAACAKRRCATRRSPGAAGASIGGAQRGHGNRVDLSCSNSVELTVARRAGKLAPRRRASHPDLLAARRLRVNQPTPVVSCMAALSKTKEQLEGLSKSDLIDLILRSGQCAAPGAAGIDIKRCWQPSRNAARVSARQ